MKTESYTISYVVDQSPQEVFDAINNVRGWWSGEIDGRTDKLGAEFTYHTRTCTAPPRRSPSWCRARSRLAHRGQPHQFREGQGEWNGTDVVFEIAKKGAKTELRFTHVGLVAGHRMLWKMRWRLGFYINESLRNLITTGKGDPNEKG